MLLLLDVSPGDAAALGLVHRSHFLNFGICRRKSLFHKRRKLARMLSQILLQSVHPFSQNTFEPFCFFRIDFFVDLGIAVGGNIIFSTGASRYIAVVMDLSHLNIAEIEGSGPNEPRRVIRNVWFSRSRFS